MTSPCKGLPSTLNITGRPYSVIYGSSLTKEQNLYGFCDNSAFEIHVDDNQHDYNLRDTVLHEALHAISSVAKLKLKERQVAVLAAQVLDLLKRNPEFTRWLLK